MSNKSETGASENSERAANEKRQIQRGSIPVQRVIEKLDTYFAADDLSGAERLLKFWGAEARSLGDRRGLLTLLSEKAGLCRRTGDSVGGLGAAEEALEMLGTADFSDGVSEATVKINCATTMKAFGKAPEALPIYKEAEKTYKKFLPENHEKFAGLYNNAATAYAELKDYKTAEGLYLKALKILDGCGVRTESAVSLVNLAHLYYDVDPFDPRCSECMERAWECLDSDALERDENYAFVSRKCAPSFGFFGFFVYEKELCKRADEIYGAYGGGQ